MSVCYVVSYYPGSGDPSDFLAYYLDRHAPLLRPLPGIRRLEVFTPAGARDPLLPHDDGPILVTQMMFDSVADLETAVLSDARMTARSDVANFPPFGGTVRHQAMLCDRFPLAAGDDGAPVVYHVQYHRPAPDEHGFVAYYRAHHPPILARLPGIRRVAVYTAVDWNDAPFVVRNDLMLINEVAFDSADALTAALESDVRLKAREDYNSFPPFDGPVTHTPMRRHVLLG